MFEKEKKITITASYKPQEYKKNKRERIEIENNNHPRIYYATIMNYISPPQDIVEFMYRWIDKRSHT